MVKVIYIRISPGRHFQLHVRGLSLPAYRERYAEFLKIDFRACRLPQTLSVPGVVRVGREAGRAAFD